MLDLPGLYSSHSQGQDQTGKKMVEDMAQRYMSQENSIILLVVSAIYDFVNHVGPSFLTEGSQERTLAVLTKPDASDDPKRPLRIMKGDVDGQNLTWYCLRNLSSVEREQRKSLRERER